jgi:hypothetical protein
VDYFPPIITCSHPSEIPYIYQSLNGCHFYTSQRWQQFILAWLQLITLDPPPPDCQYLAIEILWYNRFLLGNKNKPSGDLKFDKLLIDKGFLILSSLLTKHPHAKHLSQLILLPNLKQKVGVAVAKYLL